MSTQILAVISLILVQVLPYFGITVESVALENLIQTLWTIGAGLWIWYQRVMNLRRTQTGHGDVNGLGVRE